MIVDGKADRLVEKAYMSDSLVCETFSGDLYKLRYFEQEISSSVGETDQLHSYGAESGGVGVG